MTDSLVVEARFTCSSRDDVIRLWSALAFVFVAGCGSSLLEPHPGSTDASVPLPSAADGGDAARDASLSLDGGDAVGNCTASGIPAFDTTLACAAPTSAQLPYSDGTSLASLVIGDWLRCEGPIQPQGMAAAPDGQDGIEFDLDPALNLGEADGLLPSGPCLDRVLLYQGDAHIAQYEPTSWAFASTAAGPGIVFQGESVVYDNPVFSAGGKRMVLSDPLYYGTYVRR